MLTLQRLHAAVAAVCPIDGVRLEGPRVDPTADATPEQIAAAADVIAGFDWSPEADAAWAQAQAVEQAAALIQSGEPLPLATRCMLELLGDWVNELHHAIHGEYRLRTDILAEWQARMSGTYQPPGG